MARSRRTSNPVTLFPFLAVLLCTIGALVLMLVVVSAGIRKEAVAIASAKHAAKANPPKESPQPGDVAAAVSHGPPLTLNIDASSADLAVARSGATAVTDSGGVASDPGGACRAATISQAT
jgi:hypothetical protein